MTSITPRSGALARRRESLLRTISAYARLANLKVYFQWIPALVAWSLVPQPFGPSGSEFAAMALFAAGVIAVACAAGALDDVQGAADGIDQAAYAVEDALRSRAGKPLVQGEIDERAARRFASATAALGLGLGAAAVLTAPHSPWWLVACWLLAGYAATQYSYGVKLSYHGLGELLLALEAVAVFSIPVVFLTGGMSVQACFEAYLLGTLFAQVTLFSSSQDAEVDRAAGRMTLAARLSPRGNRRLVATVFVTGWTVTTVGFATGALSPWLLPALMLMWAIQGMQLVNGLGRRRWLVARFYGWRAFDAGVLALVLVNLLVR
jgi:1,4-dihydroxy-2-naphthoate octaprenyltransferase